MKSIIILHPWLLAAAQAVSIEDDPREYCWGALLHLPTGMISGTNSHQLIRGYGFKPVKQNPGDPAWLAIRLKPGLTAVRANRAEQLELGFGDPVVSGGFQGYRITATDQRGHMRAGLAWFLKNDPPSFDSAAGRPADIPKGPSSAFLDSRLLAKVIPYLPHPAAFRLCQPKPDEAAPTWIDIPSVRASVNAFQWVIMPMRP